tara:strand:+ start:1081 stop:1326 length:246 start_codon:yes stop_codon:yes gene_type:complete
VAPNSIKGNMGIEKKKYIEEQIKLELEVVDSTDGEITFKVVEEEPEHVKDERKVDEAIDRMYINSQEDLFDSDTWNWSGLR